MDEATAEKQLKTALAVVGGLFIVAVYPLVHLWPAGWRWQPPQGEYELMIVGVYAVLGVFLLLAARDPLEHLSLIWFTVWSSVAHGGIMLVQALVDPVETGHLLGDVPALLVIAAVLGWLTRRATAAEPAGEQRPGARPG